MPDEVLEPTGTEEVVAPIEGSEETTPETPAADPAVIERAQRMGWKGPEDYRGPADKFVTAEEFIRKGEEELPVLRERLRRQDRSQEQLGKKLERALKTIEEMAEGFQETKQEKALQKLHTLKEQRRDAVLRGDQAAEEQLDQEIFKLASTVTTPVQPGPGKEDRAGGDMPQFSDDDIQVFENWTKSPDVTSWYMKDREMTEEAVMFAEVLSRRGIGGQEQLDRVLANLKRLYPEKFVTQKINTNAPANTKPAGVKETPGASIADLPPDEYSAQRRREMGWDK